MIRLTTPTHTFTFPFSIEEECKVLLITYSQNGKHVMELGLDDVTVDGDEVSYHLTQEDTKKFKAGMPVELQARVVFFDDNAVASNIHLLKVSDVLNDEVL